MTKPNEFRKTYVLSTNVSYHVTQQQKGPHAGEGTCIRAGWCGSRTILSRTARARR